MANPLLAETSHVFRLPPGFRFRPTDEELVVEYLKKKANSVPLPAPAILDIDLGKHHPWDLPGVEEGEGYFFSLRGLHNRARGGTGYWKATGKTHKVVDSGNLVGMKKVLRYYCSNASRTDWIMHEYRLASSDVEARECRRVYRRFTSKRMRSNSRFEIKEWVACRVFKKERATRVVEIAPSSSSSSCVTEVLDECSDGEGDSNSIASSLCGIKA